MINQIVKSPGWPFCFATASCCKARIRPSPSSRRPCHYRTFCRIGGNCPCVRTGGSSGGWICGRYWSSTFVRKVRRLLARHRRSWTFCRIGGNFAEPASGAGLGRCHHCRRRWLWRMMPVARPKSRIVCSGSASLNFSGMNEVILSMAAVIR